MKEAEFRTWLEARRWKGEPLTETAIYGRIRRLHRVERSLTALGYQVATLDELHADGGFTDLRTQLKTLIGAGADGDRPPLELVPQASDPTGQLRNLLAVVRQYEQFAGGQDPNAHVADADEDTEVGGDWIVTARYGDDDGFDRFIQNGNWSLLNLGRYSDKVRAMQPGDRIAMRDYFHQKEGLPFATNGARVSVMRFRAVGTVTANPGDGISVLVDWTPLDPARLWYLYTNNETVWRLPNAETAARLAAFAFEGEDQDYEWWLVRPYWRERLRDGGSDADRIRRHVLETYIEPAREAGDANAEVHVLTVNNDLGLNAAWPNICQAMEGRIFHDLAEVPPPQRIGRPQSTATRFVFDLDRERYWALAGLRERLGAPIATSKKMASFQLTDGRQLALDLEAARAALWVEAGNADYGDIEVESELYPGDRTRHSNLPRRLKHGGTDARAVLRVEVPNHEVLDAVLDRYAAAAGVVDIAALQRLRAAFLAEYPDFSSFDRASSYAAGEGDYKQPIIAEAQRILAASTEASDATLGGALLDLIGSKQHNLLGYFKIYQSLLERRVASSGAIDEAAGRLVRSQIEPADAIQDFVDAIWPWMQNDKASKPYGDSRIIPTLLLALVRPKDAIFVRTTPFNNAGTMLLGRKLYGWNPLTAAEYADTLKLSDTIFAVMRDEWQWQPRDLWDVQGFLWVTCQSVLSAPSSDMTTESERRIVPDPTNLILYGPPGTGKTFATAEHAVRLCGDLFDGLNRDALMARYRELTDAGRIEFVTFHQSMAYEDFVEGLRPSSTDEDGQALATGFRLAPTPGIFRRIARRAETSTGFSGESFALGSQEVFKMSLGEAANPDDAHLFEDAIAQGHIVLGFDDVDWSDDRYADRTAIIAAIQAQSPDTTPTAQSAAVQMPNMFRNWMKEGDWVVVSKGNRLFRAIGIVTGGYHFVPREGGGYAHRRDVRWLWVDRAGVPVEEIYSRNFSQRTITGLFKTELNVSALERYANSQQDTGASDPEHFVLVIDEINRANISKVFGELITLLEPDKRLGKANELKVRLPYSGERFGVPANLHIIGTMNTADRSIALIDKALRRRFDFVEVMPVYDIPGMDAEVSDDGVTLALVLKTLNDRIEYLLDREHQIGHGWLLHCDTKDQLDTAMRGKIIPLIAEYFFEDWGRTADVLGGREDNPFLEAIKLTQPPGMSDAEPRIRWAVRTEFAPDAYSRLVG